MDGNRIATMNLRQLHAMEVSEHVRLGHKPLKTWIHETAQAMGISYQAAMRRMYRGSIKYPKVHRVNRHEVFVIE